MSTYNEFAAERDKIDFLTGKGYVIRKVTETLDGANVVFEKRDCENEMLFIRTADARKYFTSIIIKQQKVAH